MEQLPRFDRRHFFNIPQELLASKRGGSTRDPLVRFVKKHQEEWFKHREAVARERLFDGFKKGISIEQQLEDYDMYFYIWLGAQEKYLTPRGRDRPPLWGFLWLTQMAETTDSTDPNSHNKLFVGAMQRSRAIYPNEIAAQAAEGYEFFSKLPQRFLKSKGFETNDYEEIFFAAWKLRQDAQRNIDAGVNFEEAILRAMYRYCAQDHAEARIKKYKLIKGLFIPGNHAAS